MIIRNESTKAFEGIRCDKCGKNAPSAEEIREGFGLMNMGWQCLGGKHACNDCPHDDAAPVGQASATSSHSD